jgi:hypothetical protein
MYRQYDAEVSEHDTIVHCHSIVWHLLLSQLMDLRKTSCGNGLHFKYIYRHTAQPFPMDPCPI